MKACWLDWAWALSAFNSLKAPTEFDLSLLEALLLITEKDQQKEKGENIFVNFDFETPPYVLQDYLGLQMWVWGASGYRCVWHLGWRRLIRSQTWMR